MQTQGMSLIGLPLTNPMMWARFVDAANEAGQSQVVKSIEKATPVIKSSLVRHAVTEKVNNNKDN